MNSDEYDDAVAGGGAEAACAGCGVGISDRYYLSAIGRRWHVTCLRCCACHRQLDATTTCYVNCANVYCALDFCRSLTTRVVSAVADSGGYTHSFRLHTHPFNGPFSGTTRVSRCQKGKTNLDFTEARDSEWQWHQLGRMQVCISLQTDNHASTPSLSFLQAGCPSCRPTNSVKALKAVIGKNIHGPGPFPPSPSPSSSSSSIFLPLSSFFPSSFSLPREVCPFKYS